SSFGDRWTLSSGQADHLDFPDTGNNVAQFLFRSQQRSKSVSNREWLWLRDQLQRFRSKLGLGALRGRLHQGLSCGRWLLPAHQFKLQLWLHSLQLRSESQEEDHLV